MKQDAHTVVNEAQAHVRSDLRTHGRVRPAVFMLARVNPQTKAPLGQPAAIGQIVDGDMDVEARSEWFDAIRTETERLRALAVAIAFDAEAEVDGGATVHMAVVSIEDDEGVEVLVAPIDHTGVGIQLGAFGALDDPNPSAAVGIPPLLSAPAKPPG